MKTEAEIRDMLDAIRRKNSLPAVIKHALEKENALSGDSLLDSAMSMTAAHFWEESLEWVLKKGAKT